VKRKKFDLYSGNGNAIAKNAFSTAMLVVVLSTLSACGGGSDSDEVESLPESPETSTFSLAVSDAPVDYASEVVVYFDQIELTGNGEAKVFDVRDENDEPKKIDLLTLGGDSFEQILGETEIPAGDYGQLRLTVTDESYIVMDDGTFPLTVPGSELKLDGFTAQPGVEEAYTVEFDLRRSLVDPQGQQSVFLKPRGVRLVSNDNVGTITGIVSEVLITAPECSVKMDAAQGNAVYLYEGHNLEMAVLGDDADSQGTDTEIRPVSVTDVIYDDADRNHHFNIGFVPSGEYTMAFTCLALYDEPETDEDQNFLIQVTQEVTVESQNNVEVTIE